jgi:hypothetical protein
VTIDDVDEALATVGYEPSARAWLVRAGLLSEGAPAAWKV